MKTIYVNQISKEIQESVRQELVDLNLSTEDVNNAMDSRLCDLSDTIDIKKYI